jgi:lysozyme family protein
MRIAKSRLGEFERYAHHAIANREVYETIQAATAIDGLGKAGEGVPWWLIAALHRRESDCDFETYLGNGEPLGRKTRMVPRGRGPFKNFVDGAIDALKIDGLSSVIDWRLEKALYFAELFNGTGYDSRGLPSPYIWGGTNIQVRGKYTGDSRWSGRTMDTQPGVAPLILAFSQVANDIQLLREAA